VLWVLFCLVACIAFVEWRVMEAHASSHHAFYCPCNEVWCLLRFTTSATANNLFSPKTFNHESPKTMAAGWLDHSRMASLASSHLLVKGMYVYI
jgi:hypothetical protein